MLGSHSLDDRVRSCSHKDTNTRVLLGVEHLDAVHPLPGFSAKELGLAVTVPVPVSPDPAGQRHTIVDVNIEPAAYTGTCCRSPAYRHHVNQDNALQKQHRHTVQCMVQCSALHGVHTHHNLGMLSRLPKTHKGEPQRTLHM